MLPSNTQICYISKPLTLAGIKDIWQLPAEPWTPTSHVALPKHGFARGVERRSTIWSLDMMAPSVAKNGTIPDFPSSSSQSSSTSATKSCIELQRFWEDQRLP